MRYPLIYFARFIALSATVAAIISPPSVRAEWSGDESDHGHGKPVYQRRAFDWMDKHGGEHGRGRGHHAPWIAPQVHAGWFQRPYPYHLDYYKMRYGGSYAPYFGNLYGPPQVVTAPPYYGPYYGNFGYGDSNGAGQQGGFGGMPGGYPGYPNGAIYEGPVGKVVPKSSEPENVEGLPTP